ncbi:hypothetical protein NPIL_199721 [Nephila pilipes]|uniref:Uncharacterized protein n=1 Tax=Nephila pilipes TaxID=299642 RepID=A0A8X6NRV8_NEPPI|nr:hypothetical protein NPIL_199721 [Nephila pilipes]
MSIMEMRGTVMIGQGVYIGYYLMSEIFKVQCLEAVVRHSGSNHYPPKSKGQNRPKFHSSGILPSPEQFNSKR